MFSLGSNMFNYSKIQVTKLPSYNPYETPNKGNLEVTYTFIEVTFLYLQT